LNFNLSSVTNRFYFVSHTLSNIENYKFYNRKMELLTDNEVYRGISHDKELLSLVWLPSTKDMTVEDFKACNLETACLVEKHKVKQLL
jgi:hypothetical protein